MSNYKQTVWDEQDPQSPNFCPHCGEELAHPDDLRENDEIPHVYGLFTAYRRHRQTHFNWGDDTRTHGENGDPYLASYYPSEKSATWTPDEDSTDGDPEEVVGHVFDVSKYYESVVKARVVAPNKAQAKDKAEQLFLQNEEDLTGHTPEPQLTHEVHTDTQKVRKVERQDEELAERMNGWPW